MRRLISVTASALLGVALLSGCQQGRTDAVGAGDDLPDCSSEGCADAVTAFGQAVASLPVVSSVSELDYEAEQVTDSASVSGTVEISDSTTCAALEDELGRLLWESAINPVASVQVRCYEPGASGSDYEFARYSLSLKDEAELTDRWGPRGG